jgi:hypothetical protein
MSISTTAKGLRSSERFMLVRVEPARDATTLLASAGSGLYTYTFNAVVSKVTRNGVELTADASSPSVNDHYYHNESTGVLTVKLASAPNASTNVIIVYYYLFYTSLRPRTAYQTPTDNTTSERAWEPRLVELPTVAQTYRNAIGGVLSISSGSVSLINTDRALQAYLTDNDSFYNKAIDIWVCIDSTDEIQKIFTGRVQRVALLNERARLVVSDGLAQLNKKAFMGDTADEAIYKREASSFPDMYPGANYTPVPFIFGSSRFAYKTFTLSEGRETLHSIELGGASTGFGEVTSLDHEYCTKAICTDYSVENSDSENRVWGIARTRGNFRTIDIGNPTGGVINYRKNSVGNNSGDESYNLNPADDTTGTTTRRAWQMDYAGTPDGNLKPGDSFVWDNGLGGGNFVSRYFFMVTHVGPNYVRGYMPGLDPSSSTGTFSTANVQTNQAPALVIYDTRTGQRYFPCYDYDFTYSITTTSGGNKYMEVTFNDGFETATSGGTRNHTNMSVLHPSVHTVGFRVEQATASSATTHAVVMQTMLEAAGLAVNAASITAANSALTANASFTIPYYNQAEIGSYLEYCQDLAFSTLGYVAQNNSQEIEYVLFEAPAASTEIDTNLTEQRSVKVEVEYQDIVTEVIASNPHRPDDSDSALTFATASSNKAKYLHGFEQRKYITHLLDDITGRIDTHLALLSQRRATYEFTTATELITAELGDDLTLSSNQVLGGSGSTNLKIISMDNNATKTIVQATDLKGL